MANRLRLTKATEKTIPEIEGNPVQNKLLLDLPPPEYDSISSRLTFVRLRLHDVLEESEEIIKYGYFVDSGEISGVSGKEGCTALPIAVGLKTSISRIVVQIPGAGFRIASPGLVRILRQCPILEKRMQQCGQVMAMQSAQVAACNRLHEVDERLARWLLMSQDRIESDVVPLHTSSLGICLGHGAPV